VLPTNDRTASRGQSITKEDHLGLVPLLSGPVSGQWSVVSGRL
jgi:hypothetical protein